MQRGGGRGGKGGCWPWAVGGMPCRQLGGQQVHPWRGHRGGCPTLQAAIGGHMGRCGGCAGAATMFAQFPGFWGVNLNGWFLLGTLTISRLFLQQLNKNKFHN